MARLRLFAALREAAGTASDEIEAGTVRDLLSKASEKYGEAFSLALQYASVAVNGTSISHLQGEDTALTHVDEVALLPPVSGGLIRG